MSSSSENVKVNQVADAKAEMFSLDTLSKTSLFSLSALLATALHDLFDNPYDKKFTRQYLNDVLQSMKTPDKVRQSCQTMLNGAGSSQFDQYARELMKEVSGHLVLRELLVISLKICKGYDARVRILFKQLCHAFHISWDELEKMEEAVTAVVTGLACKNEEAIGESEARKSSRNKKRYLMIGLAAVGGGALIGLTGGLAAPFVAAGAGALIGTGSAAILTTTAGAAILGSIFGAAGAGLTGFRMSRRVGALEEFEFRPIEKGPPHLCITIAVAGFLQRGSADFLTPWLTLDHTKEQYYLQWETKYLVEMGEAIEYFFSYAKGYALQETLKMTVLSGLLAAIAWPSALLGASSVIDNPWSVCINRAEEAGCVMADALLSREQGGRPVTLIGFSVGARVIYYCLKEMARRQSAVDGIIEDVILLGAPVSANPQKWANFEKVVAGRIINGYCKTDWLLRFLFRTATAHLSLAGLQPVEWSNRRMINVDVSSEVEGHRDYLAKMHEILALIGVRTSEPVTEHMSLWRNCPPNMSKVPSLPDIKDNVASSSSQHAVDMVKTTASSPSKQVEKGLNDLHLDKTL